MPPVEEGMFKNPTVFILGAGASWHYGYPTGEDLVKKVIQKARLASNYFKLSGERQNVQRPKYIARDAPKNAGPSTSEIKAQWTKAHAECENLMSRLRQVDPLVIDYFLNQNPSLAPIGRLLIAWVILECGRLSQVGNINRRELLENSPDLRTKEHARITDISKFKDRWYRFVLHKLVTNCPVSKDLLRSDVHFVTFNYDVSLDNALRHGLNSIEQFEVSDIDEFLGGDRIIHVYGSVRDPGSDNLPNVDWTAAMRNLHDGGNQTMCQKFIDTVYAASEGIRVIDPVDKESDKQAIKAAKKVIENAACVFHSVASSTLHIGVIL
jgi:hypothetical protein